MRRTIRRQSPAPNQDGKYGIHLASYRTMRGARRGWAALEKQYPDALTNLSFKTVEFDAGDGRGTFVRLSRRGFQVTRRRIKGVQCIAKRQFCQAIRIARSPVHFSAGPTSGMLAQPCREQQQSCGRHLATDDRRGRAGQCWKLLRSAQKIRHNTNKIDRQKLADLGRKSGMRTPEERERVHPDGGEFFQTVHPASRGELSA